MARRLLLTLLLLWAAACAAQQPEDQSTRAPYASPDLSSPNDAATSTREAYVYPADDDAGADDADEWPCAEPNDALEPCVADAFSCAPSGYGSSSVPRDTERDASDSDDPPPLIEHEQAPSPSTVGCADGTREGFKDQSAFTTIASCAGGFLTRDLRAPSAAGRLPCGNSMNVDCDVADDLCAEGWHLCMTDGNPADLRDRVASNECNSNVAGDGLFVAAASHCDDLPGVKGFPCEYTQPFTCFATRRCSQAIACGTGGFVGTCDDGVWPNGTRVTPKVDKAFYGCGNVAPEVDGVLCCKD